MNHDTADPTAALATYGRVMAYIGMIEEIMRLALGQLEHEKIGQSEKADERIAKFRIRLHRMDFGQLLQMTVDQFKLPRHWLGMLKDAKSVRDNFAHGFWVQHIGYLRTEQGNALIVRHCEGVARHMELVGYDLLAALNVDFEHYVAYIEAQAHQPDVLAKWEDLLAAHEAAIQQDESDRNIIRD